MQYFLRSFHLIAIVAGVSSMVSCKTSNGSSSSTKDIVRKGFLITQPLMIGDDLNAGIYEALKGTNQGFCAAMGKSDGQVGSLGIWLQPSDQPCLGADHLIGDGPSRASSLIVIATDKQKGQGDRPFAIVDVAGRHLNALCSGEISTFCNLNISQSGMTLDPIERPIAN